MTTIPLDIFKSRDNMVLTNNIGNISVKECKFENWSEIWYVHSDPNKVKRINNLGNFRSFTPKYNFGSQME